MRREAPNAPAINLKYDFLFNKKWIQKLIRKKENVRAAVKKLFKPAIFGLWQITTVFRFGHLSDV